MRLFIAIELPGDLKTELGKLKMEMSGVRWVPMEQIHLTLAFLGEVEEMTVERLTGKLASTHATGFKLRLSGTGCFPNCHRPHVMWVGLEPEPRLNELVAGVHSAVLSCGIPQEERPFSPHITLARIKLSPPRDFDSFLDQHQNLKLPPFSVREFILFQSRLTPQGAVHIPVRNFQLVAVEDSRKQ